MEGRGNNGACIVDSAPPHRTAPVLVTAIDRGATCVIDWLGCVDRQVLSTKQNKDGEDGLIFYAPVYTTYDFQVTRPEGTTTVITKRYSDFDELKTKLAATEEAKQAELAKLDFAAWTWTTGGSNHEETIKDRKIKLGSWLNAVLFICPDSKDVVEFIDGEAGLLASVNDGPQPPE